MAGDEGASVTGDRMFLRQALVNIIHNAVKYSLSGSSVSVRVHHQPPGSIQVECCTGQGIPPEHPARIFDRFYRVDESRSRGRAERDSGSQLPNWPSAHTAETFDFYRRAERAAHFRSACRLRLRG
jgi:signal transduction histidine kinase